ncbi:hypothetical protein [Pseudoalteromonas obscura]|uniref:Uncharacterized protein n=1 Tax=Pseudoalteromonas obscura TaxID=3048491 RepID=A0ABT7EH24_9GAMM|nr:hypothetical protein [Pseudoalteromonas sp. P94(2023)]MDK2594336.1 hypothetical protein [Pseudoalteromonas sp. P94(2023)]
MTTIDAILNTKISIKYVLVLLISMYAIDTLTNRQGAVALVDSHIDNQVDNVCLEVPSQHELALEGESPVLVSMVAPRDDTKLNVFPLPEAQIGVTQLSSFSGDTQLSQARFSQLQSEFAIKDIELYIQSQREPDGTNMATMFAHEPVDEEWAIPQEQVLTELFDTDGLSIYPFERAKCRSSQCAVGVFVASDDEVRTLSMDLSAALAELGGGNGALPMMIEKNPLTDEVTVYIARTMRGFNLSKTGGGPRQNIGQ